MLIAFSAAEGFPDRFTNPLRAVRVSGMHDAIERGGKALVSLEGDDGFRFFFRRVHIAQVSVKLSLTEFNYFF